MLATDQRRVFAGRQSLNWPAQTKRHDERPREAPRCPAGLGRERRLAQTPEDLALPFIGRPQVESFSLSLVLGRIRFGPTETAAPGGCRGGGGRRRRWRRWRIGREVGGDARTRLKARRQRAIEATRQLEIALKPRRRRNNKQGDLANGKVDGFGQVNFWARQRCRVCLHARAPTLARVIPFAGLADFTGSEEIITTKNNNNYGFWSGHCCAYNSADSTVGCSPKREQRGPIQPHPGR